MRKKNCWMVLNIDPPNRSIKWKEPFWFPTGSSMLTDYWWDYKCGFRGLFKYYSHPWLIGDAIRVLRNIRKYEGARTQEGRLKVFIKESGKWGCVVCEENLLIINGFYWNKHFYLIYLVGAKSRRFMPFIMSGMISRVVEEKSYRIFLSSYSFFFFIRYPFV